MATGTKCILTANAAVCEPGEAIMNCHAEVLARRGLKHYLMNELNRILDGDPDTVYEPTSDGFFQVSDSFQFHFFVSKIPCGDLALVDAMDRTSSLDNSVCAHYIFTYFVFLHKFSW